MLGRRSGAKDHGRPTRPHMIVVGQGATPAFRTRHLGLHDVGLRREPLLRHRLKDQFTLGNRKLYSATRTRESPIFGVAWPNAAGCPVLNDQ
jgi:hypothetical protein